MERREERKTERGAQDQGSATTIREAKASLVGEYKML